MKRSFDVAPWPSSLVLVSLLGTVVLAAVGYGAWRVVPTPTGFTHNFGIGVALIPGAIIAGALLAMVRGYTLDKDELRVQRLLTTTHLPLATLRAAWADPAVCRDSIRVAGNGGLFSFTGWFQNPRLGRYRMLATDLRRGVVLQFQDRVVVITPASPAAFLEHLRRLKPQLQGPSTAPHAPESP